VQSPPAKPQSFISLVRFEIRRQLPRCGKRTGRRFFRRRRWRGRFEAWTSDVIVSIRSRDIEMYVNMAAERKSLTMSRVVVDRFHAFFRFLHSTLFQLFNSSCQGLQSSCPSNNVTWQKAASPFCHPRGGHFLWGGIWTPNA